MISTIHTTRSILLVFSMLPAACAMGKEFHQASGFSGPRAMAYLKEICELGPRVSGSPGMVAQRKRLVEHFRNAQGLVRGQAFRLEDRRSGKPVHMENLIVEWHPNRSKRILLGVHYDTRPFPDRDPKDPKGIFLGANDGASGVAVLMELSQFMKMIPEPLGVDFVCFDAEEYVFGPRDPYCLGSTYFARTYVADRIADKNLHEYQAGVILDMVGDKDLQIWQEQQSVMWPDTQPVVQEIWSMASRLGVREFIPRPKYTVQDDHVPLRMIAKIPTCDVIDFDYPAWHTTADIPSNCSADSLESVGEVILSWLRGQQ